jgi:hypothetical protein
MGTARADVSGSSGGSAQNFTVVEEIRSARDPVGRASPWNEGIMNARLSRSVADPVEGGSGVDAGLLDVLRRERRHAAVMFLSTGMALGIGLSLALTMALAAAGR